MLKKIYNAAGSLKTALVLFALIILVSCAGTFIRQNAPAEETIAQLQKIFSSNAETVYSFLNKTGFTDLYHTYWFNCILLLLALNLIFCSLQKFPSLYKRLTTKINTDEALFSSFIYGEKEVKASKADVKKAFDKLFSHYSKVHSENTLAAEKCRYSKAGAFITHLGLLLLLLGGFIGGIFGYQGTIAILEGKMENILTLNGDKELELPFSIYLRDFESEYYEGSSKQSAFRSYIAFVKDNKTKETVVSVNAPAVYDGVTFYQASYGTFPNRDIIFKIANESVTSGVRVDYSLKMGEEFDIPDLKLRARINDFAPALGKDSEGKLINFSTSLVNPAVNILLTDANGNEKNIWVLRNDPETGALGDVNLFFNGVQGLEYTVLSARVDPGLPIVYAGFIVLSLGVIIAFFTTHKRAWLTMNENGKGLNIRFYYHKDKGKASSKRDAESLFNELIREIGSSKGENK